MKEKRSQKILIAGMVSAAVFILWTVLVSVFDKGAIGPLGSVVGFSSLNGFVHKMTGVNMTLYVITDWLGLVPLCFMLGFAFLGLFQLIGRKSFSKVDADIYALGVFYIVVTAVYLFFEHYAVNYRPVLIDNKLEVSYPSSTTLLVMCVIPTSVMQIKMRIKNEKLKNVISWFLIGFTAFTVIGRLVCGVHWISDILGGAVLSVGLVLIYYAVLIKIKES